MLWQAQVVLPHANLIRRESYKKLSPHDELAPLLDDVCKTITTKTYKTET